MHLFSIMQAMGLGLLWGIKSSPAAIAFPFFVVGMVPYRWTLKFIFTQRELNEVSQGFPPESLLK